MPNNERYCAVIADIVNSKKIDNQERYNVQEKLQEAIDDYNTKLKSSILADAYFSGGDQLQVLFINAGSAYEFACDLREKMFPVKFRIGLGVGDWSLCFPEDNSNKQGGTSYYRARNAYEYAKKHSKNIVINSEKEIDAYINILIAQEYSIFNMQTERQKEVFMEYKRKYPIRPVIKNDTDVASVYVDKGSQKEIAEKLGTKRQNISNIVRAGSIYSQRDLQGAIIHFLSNLADD